MLRGLTRVACGAFFLLLAACAVTARCEAGGPDDPIGAWKLRSVSPDGKPRECVVTVSRDGATLKGTYTAEGRTRAAKDVVFDRGVLSVRVDGEFASQVYGLTYKGQPLGDSLRGTVHWSFGWAFGSFAFEGDRIAQTVAVAP